MSRNLLFFKTLLAGIFIPVIVFFIIVTGVISAPPVSQAQGLKAAIFDIAPWGYRDKDGKIGGIQFEIIKAISNEMGEEIDIQLVPYKRMIENLETGVADFAIFYRSKTSEKSGEPIAKWGKLDIIVVGLSGTEIHSYEDLKPLEIGVRLGGSFEPRFDDDTTLKKFSVDNYSHGIKLLMAKRVDAVIGTAATLYYEFQKQGVKLNQIGEPFFINSTEDWLHFSRKSTNQDKKEKLIQATNALVQNGTFDKIFSKYLPEKWNHF